MKNNKIASLVDQFMIIIAIVSLFLSAAIYRYVLFGKNVPGIVFCVLSPMVISLLAWGIKKMSCLKRESWNRDMLLEVLLFVLVVLLRIPLFHYMQKYDGGIYWGDIYKCTKNFEFSLRYVWENFKIWGHPSIMFTFFSMIGEFFTLGNTIGYSAINTIMSAFSVLCIYRICLRKLDVDKIIAFLICITLQCIPLFWGTFSHVNPDYMLFIFFVYMWYSHVFEKYILCFFWMFCMFQTKETGYVIVFGYALAYVISIIWHKHDSIKDKLTSVIKDPYVITCCFIALAQGIIFLVQGDVLTWQLPDQKSHKWIVGYGEVLQKGTDVNAFGFYPKYIVCKIVHMFGLNYSWIATLIIIVGIVYLHRHHLITDFNWKQLNPLLGALIVFASFNSLYITFALYRYNVLFVVMYWFIALLLLAKMIKKKRTYILCNAAIMLVLIIQTFYNTDVISDFMFNKYPTGKGYIVATEMKKGILGDNIVNNYKYSYIDELIDKMLAEVDYSEDIVMVYADNDEINRVDVMALDTISGNHLYAGWDRNENKRVVFDDLNAGVLPIKAIPYNTMLSEKATSGSKYLVYFFDFANLSVDNIKDDLVSTYAVEDEEIVNNWGGDLHYLLFSVK